MIASMTKYSFVLLKGEEAPLLEKLQDIGLVDITRSTKPVDETSQKLAGEVELLDGLIQGLQKAVIPEDVKPEHIDGDIVRLAGGQIMRYSEDTVEIKVLEKEVKDLMAWGQFDRSILDKLAEAGVPVHFHILPQKQFKKDWEQEYALTIINGEKGKTVYFVVAGEDPLPGEVPVPESSVEEKKALLEEKKTHFKKTLRRMAGARERIPELEKLRVEALEKLDLYLAGVTASPAAEDTISTLVGYAPTQKDETVTAALDQTGVLYIKEEAQVKDNPPITFSNNSYVKMFEPLTDMYGRPAYNGFDPTPFISIFFLLFFALCMGDAGYGLVLIGIGLLLKKVDSFKDMAPLVTTLGIGTVIVGFFMHSFFSVDISTWKVFEPVKFLFIPAEIAGYAGGMVLSIVVGIVHICLAMLVKAYQAVKVKGFYASLGTLGWTLLIVGGVVVGGLALAGVMDSAITKWVIICLGVVSALGIFVFNDPQRNKLANVGMGLWDTYNTATGLLGDVLSYLRLYALGLAGGMLGMAFNDMGKMILGDGSSAIGWIFFVLLVLVGHTLNIAMCALGAFVHPLRLNFLEFFKNSGYEAAGRNYNPIKKQ